MVGRLTQHVNSSYLQEMQGRVKRPACQLLVHHVAHGNTTELHHHCDDVLLQLLRSYLQGQAPSLDSQDADSLTHKLGNHLCRPQSVSNPDA